MKDVCLIIFMVYEKHGNEQIWILIFTFMPVFVLLWMHGNIPFFMYVMTLYDIAHAMWQPLTTFMIGMVNLLRKTSGHIWVHWDFAPLTIPCPGTGMVRKQYAVCIIPSMLVIASYMDLATRCTLRKSKNILETFIKSWYHRNVLYKGFIYELRWDVEPVLSCMEKWRRFTHFDIP